MKESSAAVRKKAGLTPADFVHLHNHTQYSLLDGLTKLPNLVEFVKSSGMKAVAMTDHGTLSGAIDFYKAATAEGIKPLVGMEAYVAARAHTDKDPQKDKNRFHLILLASNLQGYKNLMRLSTIANLEGFYYFPRIDHELLKKYNQGLIVLSGCMSGEVAQAFRNDDPAGAERIAKWYKSVFKDRYYLEIQDHGHPKNPLHSREQLQINQAVLKLGEKLNIPVVVTSDAHYLHHEDQEAHEALLCVGTGAYLADQDRMSLADFPLHVADPKEIIERWGDEYPQVILNTRAIAERCNLSLELGKILIPKFPIQKGETEKDLLHKLVFQGLAWRYGGVDRTDAAKLTISKARQKVNQNVLQRADYELSVIDNMGFNGYFLIVQDFINWGKDQQIVFGPGRGSAAGSIVAYATRITELDPLKYDLLFERFLNPDRISMPDIDIDIQDTRRGEVIEYCTKKYGADRVANIVTFGTMAARAAVRDVARVMQVPYAEADHLAKLIPPPVQGRHIPLSISIQKDPDLKNQYQNNSTAKRVIDLAIKLEGTIRSHGVHAAGVVIAPDDIVNFVPLEMAQKGVIATQYPMYPIGDIGLLKIDFLGLSNLTIIKNAQRIIKKVYNSDIAIEDIPLDDKKTYELFQRGDTTGIFQFESSGMKRYLRELKPTVFQDIVAMGALYRPGPLAAGLTNKFIARKNGREKVVFDHPLMEPALKDTYGVMVYQEQFMQIVRDMCGFTGGESDTLRKAVGKKSRDLMAKMKDMVIEGGVKKGVDRSISEKFWKELEGFADYAFNKSHAACYGLISYWTAYLKAHYPDAFMAALMTSDADNIDRLAIEIAECKHLRISVLPPDINQSFMEFAIVPNKQTIRFGMAAIKGVGVAAVEAILSARDQDGPFKSLADFAARIDPHVANRKAYESLIKTGAFDSLVDRSVALFNLDSLLSYGQKIHRDSNSAQADLFSLDDEFKDTQTHFKLLETDQLHSERERLQWERDLLGLYLSAHPLDNYQVYLSEQTVPLNSIGREHEGSQATLGGIITSIRQVLTKSGTKMAFIEIEDKTGIGELIVFPNSFAKTGEQLIRDAVIKAKGRLTARDRSGNPEDSVKLVVDEISLVTEDELKNYQPIGQTKPALKTSSKKTTHAPIIDDVLPAPNKKLYVHIKNPNDHDRLLKLKQAFSRYPGEHEIILVLGEHSDKSAVRLPFTTDINDDLRAVVEQLYGPGAVVLA